MSKKRDRKKTTAGVNRTPSNLRNFEKETIGQKERMEIGLKAARLRLGADDREKRMKDASSAERKTIKDMRAQAHEFEQMFKDGYRMVASQTLFSDKSKKARGEDVEEDKPKESKSDKVTPIAASAAN